MGKTKSSKRGNIRNLREALTPLKEAGGIKQNKKLYKEVKYDTQHNPCFKFN
jgi:ribosomal protein L19E